MAEIAVLRTHIVNYAKTRETYVAYRKAGYSRKFREEHEQEILLHQAAKNAFDEMGVKKLPKVKDLQSEYAKLLEEKKKTYAEYRRSREEMRELLTAKANVDRLLKMDEEQKKNKKKTTASGKPVMVISVHRTRSRRMKFCVQRLGALPSTSKAEGKSRQDFSLCGPSVLTPALLATFVRKQYPYPLHDDLLLLS